ncbi:MAG: Asp-tRNA(Asn)/Glu-tRNA(Gln) amidotransferase subunit GatC [Arenicellales bacterium]|nr:Asp-tRNA(Asn)/Glu-tRNA(Gln) amidotransferase subunit GatC [Arenicellales bacterium]MDP6948735.1 Asp-tRNA(Asn)/Glu-tRNA(Gln) amidotransferase subunit GatC [Arenicellales bacterium]
MSISTTDVERVARLARIQISPEELGRYRGGLSRILELVGRMNNCDTAGIEPMAHPQDIALRLRDDKVDESDQRALFQAGAPAVDDGLYLVPRVIE